MGETVLFIQRQGHAVFFDLLPSTTFGYISHIRGLRVIHGTRPGDDRVLVLWRKRSETDTDTADEWFRRQGYNSRDLEYDLIHVHGDNNLENLRREDHTWKIRLIEEDFHRLMFDVEDVWGRIMDRNKLKTIKLRGYKSFKDAEVHFSDVTVLLGANGAGKSNLVSFFRMLNFISTGALQDYIGRNGGSDSLLHYGRKTTTQISAEIEFAGASYTTHYHMRLADAAPDTLIFTDERAQFHETGHLQPQDIALGAGHKESELKEKAQTNKTCGVLFGMLSRCRVFQFHDTSETAKIRKSGYIEDGNYLRSDAGNLAAYLKMLQTTYADCYQRIVDTIALVFPSFGDFGLQPSPSSDKYLLLNWKEQAHADYLLGPHQLSDGTLRFMALATLFLQPAKKMPSVIILDEPELGLHPYAISVLAGLVKSAAVETQVVLATQSPRLVDEFEPGQIVVLEADKKSGTQCKQLEASKLSEWLDEYSMGELWEKNIFGGRP